MYIANLNSIVDRYNKIKYAMNIIRTKICLPVSNNLEMSIAKFEDNYCMLIKDNNTNIIQEIFINEAEFKVLDIAIRFNHGIVVLPNNEDEVYSLYNKGLVKISSKNLDLLVVDETVSKCYSYMAS